MKSTSNHILTQTQTQLESILPEMITLRHDLHAHPQLAFEETYAAARITEMLTAWGIAHETGLAKTGVVAWITPTNWDASNSEKGIALRGDIDALPITEKTSLPYASTHEATMHACGHDGHTVLLLGAMYALNQIRDQLTRPVKAIFQPAEEIGQGAEAMINAGALEAKFGGFQISEIFGIHGWPQFKVGQVQTKGGQFMAATNTLNIKIIGRAGHAGKPHEAINPITTASKIAAAFESLPETIDNEANPVIASVTQLHAGQASNIIPDTASLTINLRALTDEHFTKLETYIRETAKQIATDCRCQIDIQAETYVPPVINDEALAAKVLTAAKQIMAEEDVNTFPAPAMVSEDFSWFGRHAPACFAYLGVCPRDQDAYPGLHYDTYDFTDEALIYGMQLMCAVALAE